MGDRDDEYRDDDKDQETDSGGDNPEEDDVFLVGMGDDEDGLEAGEGDEEDDEDESKDEEDKGKGGESKGEGGKDEKKVEGKGDETASDKPVDDRTIRTIIEDVKRELEGKKDEKKDEGYTHEQLDEAEDKLAEMLKNEEIDVVTFQQYMRNIRNERRKLDEAEIVQKIETSQRRRIVESSISEWAKANAPEFLDPSSSEGRSAIDWAQSVLGATKKGGDWVIPDVVGRVAFGILYKGQANASGNEKGKTDKKSGKTYEDGLKEAEARDRELRSRDNKPPKSGKKGKDDAPTKRDLEILERLGLDSSKAGLYRRLKKMGGGKAVVEVR